jgi:hypothetical protein
MSQTDAKKNYLSRDWLLLSGCLPGPQAHRHLYLVPVTLMFSARLVTAIAGA